MQEWKIKRMSVKTLERWLDSVDKLLNHYLRMKKSEMLTCPLCWVECNNCLWWIIEGMRCVDCMMKLYPDRGESINSVIDLRSDLRYKKWKDVRILQLEYWRGVISRELAGKYIKRRKNAKRKI